LISFIKFIARFEFKKMLNTGDTGPVPYYYGSGTVFNYGSGSGSDFLAR
jgi:hypothetical protein